MQPEAAAAAPAAGAAVNASPSAVECAAAAAAAGTITCMFMYCARTATLQYLMRTASCTLGPVHAR